MADKQEKFWQKYGEKYGDASSPSEGNPAPTEQPNNISFARKVGAGALDAAAFFIPGAAAVRQAEEGQDTGFVDRQMIGLADTVTLGNAGVLAGTQQELQARADEMRGTGVDDKTLNERILSAEEAVRENSGLWGQVAGSLPRKTPFGAAIEGGEIAMRSAASASKKLFPKLTSGGKLDLAGRAVAMTAIGGATTAAYSANRGMTPEEIVRDTLFAGGTTGAFSAIGDMVQIIAKSARSRKNDPKRAKIGETAEENIAAEVLNAIRVSVGDDVMDQVIKDGQLNISELVARADNGAENLIEAFPEAMIGTVEAAMARAGQAGNVDVFEAVKTMNDYLMRQRNLSSEEFVTAIGETIGTSQVRNVDEITLMANKTREQLAPQYDARLKSPNGGEKLGRLPLTNGNTKTALVSDLRKVTNNFFKDPASKSVRQLQKQLADELDITRPATPNEIGLAAQRGTKIKNNKVKRELTIPELQRQIKKLDNAIYSGVLEKKNGGSYDKAIITEYLIPLREEWKGMLYNMDEAVNPGGTSLRQLDAQYSEAARLKKNFEAGLQVMGSKDHAYPLEVFMSESSRTPTDIAAFIEGAKSRIANDLKSLSPSAAKTYVKENGKKFQQIANLTTPEVAEGLAQNVQKYATSAQLGKLAMESAPSFMRGGTNSAASLGLLTDAAILGGFATGQLGANLASGAVRRAITSKQVQSASPNRGANDAAILSELLTMNPRGAGQRINEINQARNMQQGFGPTKKAAVAAFGGQDTDY